MKLSILSSAAAIALSATCLSASAANDGTIRFEGELLAQTCQIEGQDAGQDSVDKLVQMGKVPVGAVTSTDPAAAGKYFDIKVGGAGDTNCANGLKALVRFDPASPAIDNTTGYLNIDTGAANQATNVQVRIFNQGEATPLHLLRDKTRPVEIANNEATLPFVAQYYSANGDATAGVANTRVGFQVVYE